MAEAQNKDRELAVYQSRDGQQIRLSFDTVRKYLVNGHPEWVTDQEIVLYVGMCKARGLNPFNKDCYLVKYTQNDPAATIVSIDYYRARAKAQPDCVGWQCGIVVQTVEKRLEKRESCLMVDGEKLIGGWFSGRPKGWEIEKNWDVPLEHYIKKTREGKETQFWQQEKQAEMITKVAESQGLRRCWPNEFGKLYVKEEIVQGVPLTNETETYQKPAAASNSDGLGATDSAPPVADKPVEPTVVKDGPKPDKKSVALEWVAAAPDAEIMEKNSVSLHLKGLSQSDQLEVCRAYNARRQGIIAELEKGSRDVE